MHRCINYGQGLYLMKRLANLKMRRCLCAWGGNNAVVSEIRLQAHDGGVSQPVRVKERMLKCTLSDVRKILSGP